MKTAKSGFYSLIPLHFALFSFFLFGCPANPSGKASQLTAEEQQAGTVITGAEILISKKLGLLKGKSVALIANPTSVVFEGKHLADTLHTLGITIRKIFAPEHGFRGDLGAGEKVLNGVDAKTGISLVSLYGSKKKPTAEMLQGIDIVVFDIQDVGARFYTYISTMTLAMEACAEQGKQFMVLDRPNPNGWYADGPVLDPAFSSFVGMHPVPIVHGMTVGEYAQMVNREGWLAGKKQCNLSVIPCEGYSHKMKWNDTGLKWIPPSPNLATEYAAFLYPVLCWYEGMPVSVGRGTESAFQIVGAPWHNAFHDEWRRDSIAEAKRAFRLTLRGLEMELIRFTPGNIPGKAVEPLFKEEVCYGMKFLNRVEGKELFLAGLELLENFYKESKTVKLDDEIFIPFFDKLAGSSSLRKAIESGKSPDEIYEGWSGAKAIFTAVRAKYLLYEDF